MKRLSVPLMKQEKLTCGATALSMVFKYFGKNIPARKIVKAVGGVKSYGIRTVKLADFARKEGFKVEVLTYNKKLAKGKAKFKKPSKSDIIKFLKEGFPVIIAIRSFLFYDKEPFKMGHFIIITNYKNGYFFYNDPGLGKRGKIKEEHLLFAWHNNILDSSGYLLVVKP